MGERPEGAQPKGENGEPQGAEKSPQNPADRRPDGQGEPGSAETNPNDPKSPFPGWVTSLPPEIRDALVGGNAEAIPARYRDVIRRYTRWLQEQSAKTSR